MEKLTLIFLEDVLEAYLQCHGLRETLRLGDLPLRARSEILHRAARLAEPKKGKNMLIVPREERRFPMLPLYHFRTHPKSKNIRVLCPSHLVEAQSQGPVLLTGSVSYSAECERCKRERERITPCEPQTRITALS